MVMHWLFSGLSIGRNIILCKSPTISGQSQLARLGDVVFAYTNDYTRVVWRVA